MRLRRSLCLGAVLSVTLAGCDALIWPPVAHTSDEVYCPGTNSKDRKDQEANARQCRSAQTESTVQRQQAEHDKGMSVPQIQ